MGLFNNFLGKLFKRGGKVSKPSDGTRTSKDGTTFQTAKDGKHTIITRPGDSKPSVGHDRKGKK